MADLNRIRLWLRALFRPDSVERDLREEILHHLELEIAQNLRSGMTEEEARKKAIADFGGVERFQEQTRDERATRSVEDVLADVKYALRRLGKAPGFAVVTILTLAIGIGANTAIFSVVSGVLLRPLPYHESENLVYINIYFTPESGYDFADYAVGSPEYFDYKNQNRTMESVAAVSTEPITVTEGERRSRGHPGGVGFAQHVHGAQDSPLPGSHSRGGGWWSPAGPGGGPEPRALAAKVWCRLHGGGAENGTGHGGFGRTRLCRDRRGHASGLRVSGYRDPALGAPAPGSGPDLEGWPLVRHDRASGSGIDL